MTGRISLKPVGDDFRQFLFAAYKNCIWTHKVSIWASQSLLEGPYALES